MSDSMQEQLKDVKCPICGTVGSLRFGYKLVTKPIGTYSLAGAQTKVSAQQWPELTCAVDTCDYAELASRN